MNKSTFRQKLTAVTSKPESIKLQQLRKQTESQFSDAGNFIRLGLDN